MQSSSKRPKNEPTKWASQDWERAWQSALRRVDGMPAELISGPHIQASLTGMDEAFILGDSKQFEKALIALLDHCAKLVKQGDYQQWW